MDESSYLNVISEEEMDDCLDLALSSSNDEDNYYEELDKVEYSN